MATVRLRDAVMYVVTDAGHEALLHAEQCHCKPKLVGLLIECDECGTVFGHMKEVGMSEFNRAKHSWD